VSDKIQINLVEAAMTQSGVDKAKIREVLEALRAELGADVRDKLPAIKKQFCVLISDPKGTLPPSDEFVAWVLQLPEEESPATVESRIFEASYTYNASKIGRMHPVQTVGESLENVKAGQFKERDLWVKTRTPVLVVRTRNEIPKTDGVLSDDNRGNWNK
jgi:hypothetical protein